jgi:glycosyltransferase involved in cell wall biosynthesis
MSDPDVSVVVPTRDRCDRLPLALRSALGQVDLDVEVLVVDDGSTDATFDVVSATSDSRVRYVRRSTPGGVSAARNEGIRNARAAWIAFLDDDDLWAPTKLARQLGAMGAERSGWAYAGEVQVDSELRIIGGSPPPPPEDVVEMLERYNAVPAGASNVVVSTDLLSRVGAFDVALTSSEDWDLWIRLARDERPACVRDALVAITIHPGSASRDLRVMLEQVGIVARRYELPVDRARHLRWAAWMSMLDGRRADAARYYVRAAAAGDPASLARAAVALAAPGLITRRAGARDEPARTDGAWLQEARAWVEALTTR